MYLVRVNACLHAKQGKLPLNALNKNVTELSVGSPPLRVATLLSLLRSPVRVFNVQLVKRHVSASNSTDVRSRWEAHKITPPCIPCVFPQIENYLGVCVKMSAALGLTLYLSPFFAPLFSESENYFLYDFLALSPSFPFHDAAQ